MVQDGDGPDPDTGEMSWIEDKDEEEEPGADEKIYIGKVCLASTTPQSLC